jgi:hypothetical protein
MQKLQVRNRVEAAMMFRRQNGNGRDTAPSVPEREMRSRK